MNEKLIVTAKPEAEAVAEIVRRHIEPMTIGIGHEDKYDAESDRLVLVAPHGLDLRSVKPFLDEYLTAPERKKGTAVLTDLDSFIAHVNRFKDADSVVFANRDADAPSLTAVYDYNRGDESRTPRFGQHRAKYVFPLSEEWVAWTTADGKAMGQADFAAFIEDHLTDVGDPGGVLLKAKNFSALFGCAFASAGRLLELSKGFALKVSSKVATHVNLATGETALSFAEEHEAPMKVPGAFLLNIPVFRSGHPYQIAARIRYRAQGGTLVWFYDLYRPAAAFDDVVGETCTKAQEGTSLPLFSGAPEV